MQLWKPLSSRYGELGAARVLAELIGAIVDHGEQQISQILEEMLATPPRVAARRDAPPATVPVPVPVPPAALSRGVDSRIDLQRAAGGG